MKQLKALFAVVFLLVAGCAQGQETPDQGGGEPPDAVTIRVDATPEQFAGFALAYFPSTVRVAPGTTIDFEQQFTGEPHSVTFGTLIDDAIGEARQLGPDASPAAELQEKLEALPVMLPEGPGDANQIAVNPCFVSQEPLPTDATKPCPEAEQPEFDGTHAYYSSGYIPPGEGFSVKLSEDIAAGTYTYYCNLHGAEMSGTVEVVEDAGQAESAEEIEERAEKAVEEAFAPTVEAYQAAQEGRTPYENLAGFGSEESQSTGILEFIPETIDAKVGETVTWTFFGPHTITFNSPSDVGLPLVEADDGTWHVSEKTMAPAGGPGQPAPPDELGSEERPAAPEGTPEPTEIDAGEFDGEKFLSSGFVFSAPPNLFNYSVKFTKAGEFRYACLIHPAMTGTVNVT